MKVLLIGLLVFCLVASTTCLRWSDAKTKIVNVANITINGNAMAMKYTAFDIMNHFDQKSFAWTSMSIQVVDPITGNLIPSPQIYNHHVTVMNMGQTDVWCPNEDGSMFKQTMVSAAGSDFTPVDLPRPYVYLVYNNNVNWYVNWHIINYQNETRNVTLRFVFTYFPFSSEGDLPAGFTPVRTMFITSEPYCDSEFDVPGNNTPSTVFVNSRVHISPVSGTIILLLGHYHKGGITQQLLINNTLVCEAVSQYEDGWIKQGGAGVCSNISVRLNKGETVENIVVYNNTNAITEAMGLFLAYIRVDPTPSSSPSSTITSTPSPSASISQLMPPPVIDILPEPSSDKTVEVLTIIILCLVLILIALVAALVVFSNRMYKIMRTNYPADFAFE